MFSGDIEILVVDDMSTMRKLVQKSLRDIGYSKVTEALEGDDAWKKLCSGEKKFDLIISDWNMPKMTGLDFLKNVRASDQFKNIPFIMLTAESESPQVLEAIKAGVSSYIVKPFTAMQLREKMKAVYEKQKAA